MRNVKRGIGLCCAVLFSTGGCATHAPSHLPSVGAIPIIAWGGVPESEANVVRFREMADDGLNVCMTGFSNVANAQRGLNAAQQAGVKIIISLGKLQTDPQHTADQLKTYPALVGYSLRDEPNTTAFPELAAWAKQLQAADPNHYTYINLYPNYATPDQLVAKDYHDYLEQFVRTVPTQFISFDYYPIQQIGNTSGVRGDWYHNLEDVRSVALEHGMPFWAFALSTHHFAYPTPTLAHLRLQLFSDLAYGAQALEYFTYWQSTDPIFGESPISKDGKRMQTYETVKQANVEVQGLAPVFLGSQVVSVGHIGVLPAGTQRYESNAPIESVTASGVGVIVSTIRRDNRWFLVIVNRDVNLPQTVVVQWNHSGMSGPMLRVQKDGSLQRLDGTTWRETLDPGDIAVLSWKGLGK